ncbi:hypothetical protein CAPTEDRAFT_228619 [Capitella teleta]|uniref:Uncharacterized protein n=1 Tax=Capitella teleta TaxID=283909 RepID=R7V3I6_CAPTE|nr:hypothetical protein CAPTEDRAFT_228619 [Capitella teleta]|eukprot:ELU13037.1 hypothetical protein CAPTEDRAFT_228619 [Capitella teleta]
MGVVRGGRLAVVVLLSACSTIVSLVLYLQGTRPPPPLHIQSLLPQDSTTSQSSTPPHALTEAVTQPPATVPNEDALSQLRRELEIERIEVDRWKKDQQRQIAEQRQKMQEAEHSLLEEKIRFKKEIGEMMEEVRKGGMGFKTTSVAPPTAPDANNTELQLPVDPVDPAQWLGLNHSDVHAKYPKVWLDAQYQLQSFFAPDDPSAAGMEGSPQSLNDLTPGQAEDRFYQ